MEPIRKDAIVLAEKPIQTFGEPAIQAPHAAGEAIGVIGLGDRRYALRELIYREMIDEVVDYDYMTGAALFALMRKADALMEKKGLYESEGVDLSDETDRDAEGNLIVPPLPPEAGS